MIKTIKQRFNKVETFKSNQTKARAVGSRSPRWAVWSWMLIFCQSGKKYLLRLRLLQTPWFGIYLHDIYEPDDGDPHNHPWNFISVVLRGAYSEVVYPEPSKGQWRHFDGKHHRRFSIHKMGQNSAHLIIAVAQPTKTLILTGKRHSGWGFFLQDGKYVPWQEYEHSHPGRSVKS